MPTPTQLDTLTEINLDDMFDSLGLAGLRRGRGLWRAVLRPAARSFARQVAAYDDLVGERGLPVGAEWILKHFARSLEVAGRAHIPPAGPLLVLSNHPGMADTVALFVALGRPDLRIIALDRPFLRALPNTSRQLILIPATPDRLAVVRAALGCLRAGQALLTFPAGQIEPDPAVLPGASAALDQWSDSVTLFARRAPETQIMPAIVSGVLSPGAQRNPLTRLRRTQYDREKMAAMLQIAVPAYRAVPVRVAFGPPAPAGQLLAQFPDPADLQRALIGRARQLIEQPPADWTEVARAR